MVGINVFEIFASIGFKDDGFTSGIKDATGKAKEFASTIGTTTIDAIKKFDSIANQAAGAIMKFGAAAGTSLYGLAGAAVKMGMDYEAQMSVVQGVTLASSEEMVAMGDKAKEAAAKTKYGMMDIAMAMEELAKAGLTPSQVIDSLDGVLSAAAASGEDLALVSNIVAGSLNAFGESADQSSRYADILTQVANASATGIGEMGETLKNVGPIAGALGFSIEDVSVSAGLMANNMITGGNAGTALKNIMNGLQGGAKITSSAFGEMNMSMTKSDGTMKTWQETTDELRSAFSQMTEAEKSANAETIAGSMGMAGLLSIVNATDEQYKDMTETIYNSAGAADAAAKIMNDNLKGSIGLLQSAIEVLGVTFYESFDNPLKDVVNKAQGYIAQLTDAFSGTTSAMDTLNYAFQATEIGGLEDAANILKETKGLTDAQIGNYLKEFGNDLKSAENEAELLNKTMELFGYTEEGATQAIADMREQLKGAAPETSGLGAMISTLGNIIADVAVNISSQASTFVNVAVDLINALIDGLTANSSMIIDGAMTAFNAVLDGFRTILPKLVPLALDILTALASGFISYKEMLFTTGLEILTQLIQGIAGKLPELIPQAQKAIMNIVKGLSENLPKILESAIEIITQLINGITDMLPDLIPVAVDAIITIVEALIDNVDSLIDSAIEIVIALAEGLIKSLPLLIEKAPEIIEKLVSALVENAPKLLEAAGEAVDMLIQGIKDNLPQLFESGSTIVTELIAGIIDLYYKLKETADDVVNKIIDTIKETDWLKVGSDIIDGIKKGITNGVGSVKNAIKGMAESVIGTAEKAFDQHSPSRVFEKIFLMNMEGAVQGIGKGEGKVKKTMEQAMKETYDVAKLHIEDYRNASDYNANEEIKMWETLSQHYTATSKEKVEIDKTINKLRETARKEQEKAEEDAIKARQKAEEDAFKKSKDWIETKKKLGLLSMQDEINAWEKVQSRFLEGTEQRKQADLALHEVRQKLADEQEKINNKMVESENKYQKALDDRTRALTNVSGIFNELNVKEDKRAQMLENSRNKVEKLKDEIDNLNEKMREEDIELEQSDKLYSEYLKKQEELAVATTELANAQAQASKTQGQILTENLRAQVEEMERWAADLETLAAKGLDEALLDELRKMGPSASAEIAALAELTEKELSVYGDLYAEKQAIAREQATKELQALREETDTEIQGMMDDLERLTSVDAFNAGALVIDQFGEGMTTNMSMLDPIMQSLGEKIVPDFGEMFTTMKNILFDRSAELEGISIDIPIKGDIVIPDPSEIELPKLEGITLDVPINIIPQEIEDEENNALIQQKEMFASVYEEIKESVITKLSEMAQMAKDVLKKMTSEINLFLRIEGFEAGKTFMRALGEALINEQGYLLALALDVADALVEVFESRKAVAESSGGELGGNVGRYATGISYVPYDKFPAYLDKGEAVLTAAQNREYQSTMGQPTDQPVVINQYFYGVKEEQTAFEAYRAVQKASAEEFV